MSSFDISTAVFKPVVPSTSGRRSIPVVSASLGFGDIIGGWKVLWGIGRARYRIEPGLYAIGKPTGPSPVLVTANYKLSFDTLRKELGAVDAWILALDTKGVNVWCAAGKGTFGTAELIGRVAAVRLASVVDHRVLVLPQLGAPGVAAHEVVKATGFRVVYGPVRAKDVPAFLAKGMKKTGAMARVEFRLADRMRVAPVEAAHAWPFIAGALVLAGLIPLVFGFLSAAAFGGLALFLVSPILLGAFAFPALLPILPFKPFAAKGAVLGILWTFALSAGFGLDLSETAAFGLVGTSVASFIAMNFTGSSTYTNLTGATFEVKVGLPIMIVAAVVGTVIAALRFVRFSA